VVDDDDEFEDIVDMIEQLSPYVQTAISLQILTDAYLSTVQEKAQLTLKEMIDRSRTRGEAQAFFRAIEELHRASNQLKLVQKQQMERFPRGDNESIH
jgi:hypothetical protein